MDTSSKAIQFIDIKEDGTLEISSDASKFNNVCIIIPPCSLRRALLNKF